MTEPGFELFDTKIRTLESVTGFIQLLGEARAPIAARVSFGFQGAIGVGWVGKKEIGEFGEFGEELESFLDELQGL